LKTIDIAGLALNIALYVVVGYIFYALVPISYGGVRFWPSVIVPAVFAVVFGPLVGGVGAAVGIFLSDAILGNNLLLSLLAGVTSNFVAFYLLGYIAKKKTMRWTIPTVAYSVLTALFVWFGFSYSGLEFPTNIAFIGVVIASYIIFLVPVVFLRNSRWRNFQIGSVTGMLLGAAIIGITVPLFLQYFGGGEAFTIPIALSTFFFTFFTEIPFVLILGPPIIAAIYKAFPTLAKRTQKNQQSEKQ
jgi:hypothetical protein